MSDKKTAPQADNQTDDLLGGETAPTEKAAPKAKKKKFAPKDEEKHLFHVKMEKVLFDSKTGKRLSKHSIVKLNSKEWAAFKKTGNKNEENGLGFSCDVLWTPEEEK